MRRFARILLVLLALAATLREAGSAMCAASDCSVPIDASACSPRASEEAPGCCAFPVGLPVSCPLLDPTPEALIERAPVARALPEPLVLVATVTEPVWPAYLGDPDVTSTFAQSPFDRGVRPGAGPLWLKDLRFLL